MKRYIPISIWFLAAILLSVFAVRDRIGFDFNEVGQVLIRFGAYFVAVLGLMVHTILYRKDNLSKTNYGFKLMGEGLLLVLIIVEVISKLFFANVE